MAASAYIKSLIHIHTDRDRDRDRDRDGDADRDRDRDRGGDRDTVQRHAIKYSAIYIIKQSLRHMAHDMTCE